ncbi:YaiI/YqxD family protein [Alkalibacter mobilis]|uniref:YaiI/YqxD family protein n=1 Tax=Alkalibacter mobilis TaxID=2787712 RepID=UPI0018A08908|nr:DUF188 domain-containing protein [Alkalibacter mobilis]MBF7097427.1 DUF188 domain-containing protein [Alkalibacter mobilis]
MKILIDADGCPVVDLTVGIVKEYELECVILCDTSHVYSIPGIKTITLSKGSDSVDFALVNMVDKNDVVVTQDYGLAAMCLAKGATPLNQNGMVYNDCNIDTLLYARHEAKKLRNSGHRLKGPKKRTKIQNEDFEKALRSILTNNKS